MKDPRNNVHRDPSSTRLVNIRFSFSEALFYVREEARGSGNSYYADCGIMLLFQLLFSGPLYRVVTSSVGPAAVYYSPDLICLTDDWVALNPC